jgi:hypothetical protein
MLFILVMLALAAFAGAMLSYSAVYVTAIPVHLALASGAMQLSLTNAPLLTSYKQIKIRLLKRWHVEHAHPAWLCQIKPWYVPDYSCPVLSHRCGCGSFSSDPKYRL